ncbi:helix-turn-helix transcriptional regulator [Streptomyces sp. NPDC051172]|uniref:helix-turn-helix domain-containing protein n=1 Tax=Streptomyces sp. NPDC051172 TaxID=3155796 RepID=UPI00343B0B7E
MEILQGFNDDTGTVMALGVPIQSEVIRGEHERAAVLLGAVRALYRATGMCTSTLGPRHKQCEETVAGALGTSKYEKALARGGDFDSPARAIAFALGTTAESTASDVEATGPPAADPLSRREREVAALVAKGMTNRPPAGLLGLSPRTADTHVANILSKLGFGCRAQIAAWWAENQLSAEGGR